MLPASSNYSDPLTKARIRHAESDERGTAQGGDSQTDKPSYVAVIVCHDQSHHPGGGEDIIVQEVTPMAFPQDPSRSLSHPVTPSRPCLRLLCPHLVLLLSLLLLAGLAGCGPASSDNAPGVESRASVNKPPPSADGTGLETWAQSAPPGAVDPSIQALNDKDESRVVAYELLEEEDSQDLDEEEENQNLENPDEEGEEPAVQISKEVQEVPYD